MAMQPLALETGIRDGAGRGLTRWLRRPAIALGVVALALAVAGDRSRAASVPAGVLGQDPLEVLELKVRPNVIVVLDSSGSMNETVDYDGVVAASGARTGSGDHPRSKLAQAKGVLRTVIQNNEDKVSFQFGTYTQFRMNFNDEHGNANNVQDAADSAPGLIRFEYWTTSTVAPFMAADATELTVQGALDDTTLGRGLQAWQIIDAQWNTLYFEEDAATDAVCTAVLPGPFPKFYARGGPSTTPGTLAADLQSAMNAATCTGTARTNTYNVAHNTGTGVFTFSRSTGTRDFRIVWGRTPNNIRNALPETSTATTAFGTSFTTDAPYTLLYRPTTRNRSVFSITRSGCTATVTTVVPHGYTGGTVEIVGANEKGYDRRGGLTVTGASTFTYTIANDPNTGTCYVPASPATGAMTVINSPSFGQFKYGFTEILAGTNVHNYQLRAGRLWNGETVRVDATGAVCGMTFSAAKTNPPTLTVEAATAATCTPTGQSARFTFAGGSFTDNNVSCQGFRSKSSLVPCDLQSPPAPTQFSLVGPYLEQEIPFAASGDVADLTTNGAAPTTAGDSVPDGVPDYVEAQDGGWGVSSFTMAPSAKADGATPIANSLIDILGLADTSGQCVTNAVPLVGKLESLASTGTTGACVQRGFSRLWNVGQTGSTVKAGPAPWQIAAIKDHGTCDDGTTFPTPCATQRKPKEKTIVLFVTDGDDTCLNRSTFSSATDAHALRAAYWAEKLYKPIVAADSASSVQTYVIGFGGAFDAGAPNRLNWIAWGGSGLGQGLTGQPNVTVINGADDPANPAGSVRWSDTATNLNSLRAQCTTCTDAFIAPDSATLAAQLQAIIDQGASDGDFNAQQSITESVYEYVSVAPPTASAVFDAAKPSNRYRAIVPTRFIASFSLPGFKGQQKAYQNDGLGNPVLKWSAGDVLFNKVSITMASGDAFGAGACNTGAQGGAMNECVFAQLHGGATDASIRSSSARIKRRIYSTSGNGVYPYTVDSLMDGTSASRVVLWPPTAPGLMHTSLTDDAFKTPYDAPLGLPPNLPTSFPPNPVDPFCDPADLRPSANPKKALNRCWYEWMQKRLQACAGAGAAAACTANLPGPVPDYATRMQAARRETREIVLAFMAGAATVPAVTGIKRSTAAIGAAPTGSLLFKARPWILGDSELATAAVVTPPLPANLPILPIDSRPEIFRDEYLMFADGPRGAGAVPDGASPLIKMGFGLRNPDDDGNAGNNIADTGRPNLKPVMTVLYAPANDMLHAFRAGPCDTPALSVPCNEAGGEELWGFVPFDQLHTLTLRAAHEPQGKNNHVYSLARGARFADVFVPGSFSRTVSGLTVASTNGVWRRILYIGRGIGGKYMTAIDVTAPGPFTGYALDTTPPVPLWSRGNPDTADGLVGGTPNGTGGELTAYATMGETWSIPTVAYVDKNNPIYQTPRSGPGGLNHALFMGSGYGRTTGCPLSPCEGQTFYTLDALSGDVLATANVGSRSGFATYPNALVANAVGFQPKVFSLLGTVHPSADKVKRVYIGDVHGRLWKFLTLDPSLALLAADLGANEAVGTAASLLGLPPQPSVPTPLVFVTSGADKRANGPFRVFAFRDDGSDTNTTVGAPSTNDGVTTFAPMAKLFARTFDQGAGPTPDCGYPTEALFRGTVQPAAAFECTGGVVGGQCIGPIGRVFYAGTRLSLPNTKFAPVTPLACSAGVYPCRSQFDSTIYVLGAETGLAAYDLNAGAADDAYRIFRDSRIAAISMQSDPDPAGGGSKFVADEGLMKGAPKPPPPPGVPPTSRTNSRNVVITRVAGEPAPSVRYGTTVCQ